MLNIRDGTSVLLFSGGSTLLRSELDSFILSLASNRVLYLTAYNVIVACYLCFYAFSVFNFYSFLYLEYDFIINK